MPDKKNIFVDIKTQDVIPSVPFDNNSQDKRNLKLDSIIFGGVDGSIGLKINKEGLWLGSKTKSGAVLAIGMDGSNNIVSSGAFTSMIDTFSAYTTNYALVTVNATHTGLAESTIRVQPVIGGFSIADGTRTATIKTSITLDQDVSTTSSPIFNVVTSYFRPITIDDSTAPRHSIYFSSDTTTLTYKDVSGITHLLY